MESAASELSSHQRGLNSLSNITLIFTLAAVTMTFGALIVVFLLRGLQPGAWSHIELPGILWLSTALLVASSLVFERARKELIADRSQGFNRLVRWVIGLAVLFLLSQVAAGFQVVRSGVELDGNPHSWFIFLFGGLHAAHIIAGLIAFYVLYYRTREHASGPRYRMATRTAAKAVGIFWHYMDVMWIVLFGLLLFWRR